MNIDTITTAVLLHHDGTVNLLALVGLMKIVHKVTGIRALNTSVSKKGELAMSLHDADHLEPSADWDRSVITVPACTILDTAVREVNLLKADVNGAEVLLFLKQ